MKRAIFIILLFFAWRVSSAPGRAEMYLPMGKVINPYECLFKAICEYESRNDSNAYNEKENAVGITQIRPIRILDYNIRTGKNYQLEEMYDVSKSREIFMYYAQKLENPELIIRKWNGSGEKTYEYLKEIQKIIDRNQINFL